MLDEEQTKEIKQKIISHIEKTFPEEQKESAKKQLEEMNSEQFEAFLEKNNLIKDMNAGCVFCSIVSDNIKSCKIAENESAIAVLEINPISKGHSIILAKEHNLESNTRLLDLAKEVSSLLKERLNAKEVKIEENILFGHKLVNILPVYNNEDFNSPKIQTNLEELEKIKKELEKKQEIIKKIKSPRKPRVKKIKEKLWLPKRIP
jgi:diadenosine tetraphosphate (Ap4A) HIT family hydrolase